MRKMQKSKEKFDGHVTKRGTSGTQPTDKTANKYTVGPMLLGFFLFIVVGSALLQIIKTATTGTPQM